MPVLAGVLVLIICFTVKKMKDLESKLFFIIILMGCYVLCFAAHIIEKNLILSPRSNLAVWSVIAMILIVGENEIFSNKENNRLGTISCFTVVCLIGIQILVMQDMAANEQAMNAIDIMEAKQVCYKINQYENETGNIITKIAVSGDFNSVSYQESTRYRNWELGARIMTTYYSNYRLISYFLGRRVEKIDMPREVYIKYFAGKDWNCMNVDEQAICMGDTLYLVIY